MLTGQNGILNRATEARVKQSNAQITDTVGLKYSEYQMEEKISPSGSNFIEYMQNKGYISSDGVINTQSLSGNKLPLGNGSGKKDVYVLESTENGYVVNYYDENGNKDTEVWNATGSSSSDTPSDNATKRDENMFEFDATTGTILRVKKEYVVDYYNYNAWSTYFNSDDKWCKIEDGIDTLVIPNSINGVQVKIVQQLGITNVKNIIFEEGIEEIYCIANYYRWNEYDQYDHPQLLSVKIPSSVTKMSDLFNECEELSSIIIDSNNQKYTSGENENVIIDKSTNELLAGCKNSIIPDNVVAISDHAFSNCKGLTNISIPNSVTKIGNSAFAGCTGVESISIPKSVTSIGMYAFSSWTSKQTINFEADSEQSTWNNYWSSDCEAKKNYGVSM